MNIEIANRLVELRKKSGLSQEDLAEKLGLSRQAVSKWERAEASPDTDNLIVLAKLYGVSLDDILNTDEPVEDIIAATKEKEAEKEQIKKETSTKEESVDAEVVDDKPRTHRERGDKVDIGPGGIHISSVNGDEVRIGVGGIHINDNKPLTEAQKKKKARDHRIDVISGIVTGSLIFLAVVAYILVGTFYPPFWAYGWIVFFAAPTMGCVFETIKTGKFGPLTGAVVFLSVAGYMLLGFLLNLWHPGWVIFLSIPLWAVISGPVDKATHDFRHRHDNDNVIDAK